MGKELKFHLPHAWFEKTSFAIADSLMDIFFQCSTIFYRSSKSHVVTIEGTVRPGKFSVQLFSLLAFSPLSCLGKRRIVISYGLFLHARLFSFHLFLAFLSNSTSHSKVKNFMILKQSISPSGYQNTVTYQSWVPESAELRGQMFAAVMGKGATFSV